MATVSYPPFYTQKITDGEGQPVAGGKILSFYAGTDVPLAVYTEDGTSLGAEVDIDGDGYARFCLKTGLSYKLICKYADGSIVWIRDNVRVNVSGDGMANPMEAEGDIIVGGPDGQPDRLAAGTTGQVLKIGADGNPGWATDAEGMQNPMSSFGQMISGGLAGAPNVLAAPTGDQFLGVTSTVYGPFPQWWPLINAIVKGLATTPAGTASGFTKGDLLLGGDAITGGALHNYTGVDRLPIGTSGKILTSNGTTATWADPATQEGDHKAKTSATDSDPNYLENKVLGGDLIQVEKEQTPDGDGGYFENLRVHLDARGVTAGYVPTADGSNGAAWAAPAAQPGDHQLLVSAADAAAGYLGSKLTAGSNITLTPQTDGDGVQTLEIASTGGGGGGGGWAVVDTPCNRYSIGSNWAVGRIFYPLGPSVRSIGVCVCNFKVNATAAGTAFIAKIPLSNGNDMWAWKTTAWTKIATKSFSQPCNGPFIWVDFDADVDVSDKKAIYFMAIGFSTAIVSGENVGFRHSATLAGNGMTDGCEFNPSYTVMNNATKVNDINSTAQNGIKFCLGVSSSAQNS